MGDDIVLYMNYTETHTKYTPDGEEILTLTRSGDVVYLIHYVDAVVYSEGELTVNRAAAQLDRFLGRNERQFF